MKEDLFIKHNTATNLTFVAMLCTLSNCHFSRSWLRSNEAAQIVDYFHGFYKVFVAFVPKGATNTDFMAVSGKNVTFHEVDFVHPS